jgi:8-amino-7-oxononanoate synthase
MSSSFDSELGWRLAVLREQGLHRELRRVDSAQGPRLLMGGRVLLNFSSNDYLGLANEPALKQAAGAALRSYGAGAGASRLLCGSLAPHHELEEALASFKGTAAALSFSSGYATAVGTICALLSKDAIVVLDKLVHASIVDGARLSGARLRVFAHNDLNDLEQILKWAGRGPSGPPNRGGTGRVPQVLVVTESVFSMDGDQAPLRELVKLKEQHGAWLMVDEAHATGIYGRNRRGLAEEAGVAGQIEVQMGTLGKALGAAGGYIAGSRVLIDYLVNQARSFIFSTAPVPAAAAAALAGIRFVQSEAGAKRTKRLWERASQMLAALRPAAPPVSPTPPSAIMPLILGEEAKAVAVAAQLRERGLFVPAIRYPTVARGTARLRLTVTAAHSREDLESLAGALQSLDVVPPSTGQS